MMRFTITALSCVILLGMSSCKNDAPAQRQAGTKLEQPEESNMPEVEKKVKILSADDFEKYIQNNPNVPLIDLRTAEKFEKAHIYKAINIPYTQEGFLEKVKHLKGAGEVLLYDENGMRSARAAETFEKLEVGSIRILDKGLYSWAVAYKMQVSGKLDQKK